MWCIMCRFGNTICGRHPIGVFLNMVAEVRQDENERNMWLIYSTCLFSKCSCLIFSILCWLSISPDVFVTITTQMKSSRSNGYGMDLKFLNYAQSNQVINLKIRWNQKFVGYKSLLSLSFTGEKPTRLISELCCRHFCNALNSLKSFSLLYLKSETKSS